MAALIVMLSVAVGLRLVQSREPLMVDFPSETPNIEAVTVSIPGRPHSIRDFLQDPRSVGRMLYFEISTNSLGFRGGEITVPKPPERLRVVCAGDCVTYGNGVSEHEAYPHQLGAALSRRHPDLDLEVINAGMEGAPPKRILARLVNEIPPIEPDVVIFGPGAETSFLPCHTHGAPPRVWLTEPEYQDLLVSYRALLDEALTQSRTHGYELVLVTPTFSSFFYPDGQLWVDEVVAFAELHGLPVLDSTTLFRQAEARDGLLLSEREGQQRLTRYRSGEGDLLVEVAFRSDERHVSPEIYAWLDAHPEVSQLLSIDGNHANPRGHKLIAEELAKLLDQRNLLER